MRSATFGGIGLTSQHFDFNGLTAPYNLLSAERDRNLSNGLMRDREKSSKDGALLV